MTMAVVKTVWISVWLSLSAREKKVCGCQFSVRRFGWRFVRLIIAGKIIFWGMRFVLFTDWQDYSLHKNAGGGLNVF